MACVAGQVWKMSDPVVPDDHHVARYCPKSKLGEDDRARPTAFMLKVDRGEMSLSVNWLEYLGKSERSDQISELREVYKRKEYTVAPTSKFAVLQVGQTIEYVWNNTNGDHPISVIHEPLGPPNFDYEDPSHCGIYGVPPEDDNEVSKHIADSVIEHHDGRG